MVELFVGVDLGTGGARALAMDGGGRIHARGSAALPPNATRVEGERVEQDPAAWRRAAAAALRELTATVVDPAAIVAVAVDATSGSFLLVDADDEPLTPGILYSDLRGPEESRRAAAALDPVLAPYGIGVAPSFAIGKILAVLVGDAAVAARYRRIVHQADWIVGLLCGRLDVTDVSTALKTGVDPGTLRWPTALADVLGLDPDRLPSVVLPGVPVGVVDARGAAATGLRVGTPVVAGCTDGTAGCLASGAAAPGDINVTLGTTLIFKAVSDRPLVDPDGALYNHRHPDGGYLPGAASSTGGDWIRQGFPGADPAERDRAAATVLPTGRVVYPLVKAGERYPFRAPAARGFGLEAIAEPATRFAAGLEGTACLERLGIARLLEAGLPAGTTVHTTGKAAQSTVWNRIRASVLDRQVLVPAETECALGAALLAAAAAFGSVAPAARACVRIAERIDPDPALRSAYAAQYRRFVTALKERGYPVTDGEAT